MKKLFTFFSIIIIGNSLFAQLPNAGFETWTTVGAYSLPTGWDNINAKTNSMSVYTCEKGTPGNPGSSYLKLTSKTMGTSVAPGIAVSGILDTATYMPKSGFTYTSRPANFTGSWQYMGFSGDVGHIAILLSKWNASLSKRDTVSFTNYALAGMVMSWGTFTIPLTYMSSSLTPDSAIIVLAASGTTPANNSYLYVDNLAFTGSVPTTSVANVTNHSSFTLLYPNPATGTTTISYNTVSENNIKILVNDMSGRSIVTLSPKATIGENAFPLNVSGFAKGIYTVRIIDGLNTEIQKLIIE